MYLKPHCFLKTVTTATAQEPLTANNIRAVAVTLTAERSNTGYVYVGDSEVSSTNYGFDLMAGDSYTISPTDFGLAKAHISLEDIWLDVSVSGDGVSILFWEVAEE
jgi:hypothetical protein